MMIHSRGHHFLGQAQLKTYSQLLSEDCDWCLSSGDQLFLLVTEHYWRSTQGPSLVVLYQALCLPLPLQLHLLMIEVLFFLFDWFIYLLVLPLESSLWRYSAIQQVSKQLALSGYWVLIENPKLHCTYFDTSFASDPYQCPIDAVLCIRTFRIHLMG